MGRARCRASAGRIGLSLPPETVEVSTIESSEFLSGQLRASRYVDRRVAIEAMIDDSIEVDVLVLSRDAARPHRDRDIGPASAVRVDSRPYAIAALVHLAGVRQAVARRIDQRLDHHASDDDRAHVEFLAFGIQKTLSGHFAGRV